MNFTCSGGSSNVFNNALNAPVDNICTSSIIYTLYLARVGKKFTSSLILLISSTLLLDAASISTTSVNEPSSIALHISHSLQGSPSFGFKQFIASVMNEGNDRPVRAKRVRIIDYVPTVNKKITSAQDVDKVLDTIREKLLAELENNDEIDLG